MQTHFVLRVVDTQFPQFPAGGQFTQKQTRPQTGRHAVTLSPTPRPFHCLGLKCLCPFLGAFVNSRKANHLPHVYCLTCNVGFYVKFYTGDVYYSLSRKFTFISSRTYISDTLCVGLRAFYFVDCDTCSSTHCCFSMATLSVHYIVDNEQCI